MSIQIEVLIQLLFIASFCSSCQESPSYEVIVGETMGTYYKVTALTSNDKQLRKSDLDSVLVFLNSVLSTYDPISEISMVNQSARTGIEISTSDMLWANIDRAAFWNEKSNGYFDPSVMPLVNYWGFGYTEKKAVTSVDSSMVDSLMQFVGMREWAVNEAEQSVVKKDSRQQLDLSAIAKGYSVDILSEFLKSRLIEHYLIDIGGEMRGSGINSQAEPWSVAISKPSIEASPRDIMTIVRLDNRAIASSGNYRNYRKGAVGVYGHTINPLTGYPFQDKLLAVSILADNCMDADAIATSCMAMGYDNAVAFVNTLENIEACFYSGSATDTITTTFTNGFIRYLVTE